MRTKLLTLTLLSTAMLSACGGTDKALQIITTEKQGWVEANEELLGDITCEESKTFKVDLNNKGQQMDGFGACFNELGWTSLSLLSESDRQAVMTELFKPNTGANFNICRLPVAANDFSIKWYSYNSTDKDFEMKDFSIENDKKTLIPFIHAAQSQNPDIKLWASPWSPPQWMKYNKHYAQKYNSNNPNKKFHNGLTKEQEGKEGSDMFIQDERYLEAYALYFEKFIQAYRKENIPIYAVMPQNEFNSASTFPSCCWRASSLANFIGKYLGPRMEKEGVDILFGTMERPNAALVDTILNDKECSKYIDAVGFQWGGKGAIESIHKRYPDMKLYQTEQECGNGRNDWEGVIKSWRLLKHYINNGVAAYMYWNISLEDGGVSTWGWSQNSLVVVNPKDKSYKYTSEYYLMKHISHFIKPGATFIKMAANFDGLAFQNPDESIVILYMENSGKATSLEFEVDGKKVSFKTLPNSINTFVI